MDIVENLVVALKETTIAKRIGIRHDRVRAQYPLNENTVPDWRSFEDTIADYYTSHYGQCVSPGAHLSRPKALSRAKEILGERYRRHTNGIVDAFTDGRDGTNGGMRVVLDTIAEGLTAESVRRYVRDQFESHFAPNDAEAKVAAIRQLIARFMG